MHVEGEIGHEEKWRSLHLPEIGEYGCWVMAVFLLSLCLESKLTIGGKEKGRIDCFQAYIYLMNKFIACWFRKSLEFGERLTIHHR